MTKLDIVPFHKNVNKDIILQLEEMLERAKNGEFIEGVCLFIKQDGSYEYYRSGYESFIRLIGSIECMKEDVLSAARKKEGEE